MSSPKTDTLDINEGTSAATSRTAGLVTLYFPTAPGSERIPNAVLLVEDELLLGREPSAKGLALPTGSVSREHARLTRRSDEWMVEDLESRNGTFVNGAKVHHAVLADGDELRVGAVVFKLVLSNAERFVELQPEQVPDGVAALVGGTSMAAIRKEILRVARADLSVLVLGESGTGKEVVARALHASSGRPGAFAAVNCAAVPAALLEAELFGARRGAFTGLDRDRLGLVRSAAGGTLFLDEIGDMPLEAQAKLLRVLDTRQVTPLGSHVPEPVDIRVVSATHRPIVQLVHEQRFRADLFARINAHSIELPPLRQRKEDIPRLVETFLAEHRSLQVTPGFMVGLLRYDWPLNVRELETAVKRAIALAEKGVLDEPQLPPAVRDAIRDARTKDQASEPKLGSRTNAPPAEELRSVLRRCAGNVAAVARELGKDRAQIHRWLKLHGISLDEFRP